MNGWTEERGRSRWAEPARSPPGALACGVGASEQQLESFLKTHSRSARDHRLEASRQPLGAKIEGEEHFETRKTQLLCPEAVLSVP